ncbi:MAG: SPOR domain-containing protein [Sulfuriferula sp.]
MAIQATSEEQLRFKKRARQRLLGAGALLLTAAIVLPLVLDATPRQPHSDVIIDMVGSVKPADVPVKPVTTIADVAAAPDSAAIPSVMPQQGEENKLTDVRPSVGKDVANSLDTPAALPKASTPPTEKASNNVAHQPEIDAKPKSKLAAEPKPEVRSVIKAEVKAEAKPKQETKKPEVKVETKVALEPKVAVKVEPKLPVDASHEKNAASSQHFVVQLGAFSNAENVQQLRDRLSAVGVSTYTEKLPSGATRVRVGPYTDKAQADKVLAKIKAAGVQAQVVPLK